MKRRDFVKTMAISGMAVAASDLIGDLIAQTPQGKVLESKFKGLADIALAEAKSAGCSLRGHPLHARDQQRREREWRQPRFRGLRRVRGRRTRRRPWRRSRRWGRRGLRRVRWRRRAARVTAAQPGSACASSTAASGASRAARSSPRTRSGASPAWPRKSPRRAPSRSARTSSWRRWRPTRSTGRRRSRRIPPRCRRKKNRPGPESRRSRRQDEGGHQRQRVGTARARVEVLREQRRLVHRAGDLDDDRRSSR